MIKKLSSLIPYSAALLIIFYILPLLIRDTGSGMFILLLLIPLMTFICAAVYGILRGFNLLTVLVTAVLFLPSIFIFYNSSALIYTAIYSVISLTGNGIGSLFYRKR